MATVESLDVHHESELWGRIEDADCIMVYHTLKVTKATIERLTKCKLIVRCGVGYDNVDYAFARTPRHSRSPTFPITAPKKSPTRPSA